MSLFVPLTQTAASDDRVAVQLRLVLIENLLKAKTLLLTLLLQLL